MLWVFLPTVAGEHVPPSSALRAVVVLIGLAAWHVTQHLIGSRRPMPAEEEEKAGALLAREDRILQLLDAGNRWLNAHPAWADTLLIASSLLIDALGLF